MNDQTKLKCRVCESHKESALMKTLHGKPCLICRLCDNKNRVERYKKTPRSRARRDRINAKARGWRKDRLRVDKQILKDSRGNDKKKNRKNDLTHEFIRLEIMKGCSYCGDIDCRMTLDRIDNVIPSCVRCNYIRRDIPFDAWMVMVPSVREARIKGLFRSWDGSWMRPSGA